MAQIEKNNHSRPRSSLVSVRSGIRLWLLVGLPLFGLDADTEADKKSEPTAPAITQQLEVTALREADSLERVPRAVSVVTRDEQAHEWLAASLERVLRSIPGVVIQRREQSSQGDRITIRGVGARAQFGVRGIRIIQDGIPLTMPDGQSQLNNLDMASVSRVQVLRGPAASLYGNSSGGVILLDSHRFPRDGWWFQPALGANERWETRVGTHQRLGAKGRVLVSASHRDEEGFREHSAARQTRLHGVMRLDLSTSTELGLVVNVVDAPYLLNPSSLTKQDARDRPRLARRLIQDQGAGKHVDQSQAGFFLKYQRGSWQTTASLFGGSRHLFNPVPNRIIDLDRDVWGLRVSSRFFGQWRQRPLRWLVGFDSETSRDYRQEFRNIGLAESARELQGQDRLRAVQIGETLLDQIEEVHTLAPFFQASLEATLRTQISLGARYDRNRFRVRGDLERGSVVMDQVSPTLATSWQASKNWLMFTNLATGFQTPTTNELSNRPDSLAGFNGSLKAERSLSLDWGFRARLGSNTFEGVVFWQRTRDRLVPRQNLQEEVFYENAGKTQTNGLELAAQYEKGRVNLRGTYHWTKAQFREFTRVHGNGLVTNFSGNQVPGVPPHGLYLAMDTRLWTGFSVEVEGQWEAAYFANDANGSGDETGSLAPYQNDAWTRLDLNLAKRWTRKRWRAHLFLQVTNLADTRYSGSVVPNAFGRRFFEPAAGRTWLIGFRLGQNPNDDH